MSKKILFLTTEMPYPLDSGGKIRTYNIIKGIKKYFEIDLVCFIEDENMNVEKDKLLDLCNKVDCKSIHLTISHNFALPIYPSSSVLYGHLSHFGSGNFSKISTAE